MTINDKAQRMLDGALLVNMPYDKTRHFAYINIKSAGVIRQCIDEIKNNIDSGAIPKNTGDVSDNFYLYSKIIDTINGKGIDNSELDESLSKYQRSIKNIINKHLKNAKVLDQITGNTGGKSVLLKNDQVEELKLLVIQLIEEQNGNSEDLSIEKWKVNQSVSSTYEEYANSGINYFDNLNGLKDDMRELQLRSDMVTFSARLRAKYIDGIPDPTDSKKNVYARIDKEGFVTVTNDPLKESTMAFQVIKVDKPTPTLNIVFRGTDSNAEGVNMMNYLSDDYFRMEEQYNKMAPIIEDVIKYQLIKHNEKYGDMPLNVNFAGHSLGAAFAEIALQKNKDKRYEFSDFKYNGNDLTTMEHSINQDVKFTSTSFNLPPIIKSTFLSKVVAKSFNTCSKIDDRFEKFSFVGKSAVAMCLKTIVGVVSLPAYLSVIPDQQAANYEVTKDNNGKLDDRGQIIQVENDAVNIAKRLTRNSKTSSELTFSAGGKISALTQHDARYMYQMIKEAANDGKVTMDDNGEIIKSDSSLVTYLKNKDNSDFLNEPIEISDELKSSIKADNDAMLDSLKKKLVSKALYIPNKIIKTTDETIEHIGNLVGKLRLANNTATQTSSLKS